MSSCEVVKFRVGKMVGWGMGWVKNSDTNEVELLSGSLESTSGIRWRSDIFDEPYGVISSESESS